MLDELLVDLIGVLCRCFDFACVVTRYHARRGRSTDDFVIVLSRTSAGCGSKTTGPCR